MVSDPMSDRPIHKPIFGHFEITEFNCMIYWILSKISVLLISSFSEYLICNF